MALWLSAVKRKVSTLLDCLISSMLILFKHGSATFSHLCSFLIVLLLENQYVY